MSDKKPIAPFYAHRAKEVVDMLFDKRFLNDDLDRETVSKLQDFIGFMFESMCESAVRSAELSAKFRDSIREKQRAKADSQETEK